MVNGMHIGSRNAGRIPERIALNALEARGYEINRPR